MKSASLSLTIALAIGALVLQGCAQTGATRPEPPAQAAGMSVPAQSAASTAVAAPSAVASSVAIPEKDGKVRVVADTKDNFEAVAAAVRQEMQPGGRFAFVNDAGRQTVDTNLTEMQALFNQYGSVDKMTSPAQSKLLTNQNAINEVLARHDANRRVCWQETPVGTHFPKTVCRTLGEIQNAQQKSSRYMHELHQTQGKSHAANISDHPVKAGHPGQM